MHSQLFGLPICNICIIAGSHCVTESANCRAKRPLTTLWAPCLLRFLISGSSLRHSQYLGHLALAKGMRRLCLLAAKAVLFGQAAKAPDVHHLLKQGN